MKFGLGYRLTLWWSFALVASAAVVEYEWVIRPRRSRPPLSPDCFTDRDMLLVNDMNPGPEVRANKGDTIRVTIINKSPSEAISIHWHGLHMLNQPYADGTATRSQCSLGPEQTEVQEFIAYEVGTHYWHGHTSLDRVDGLQGAVIIEDPDDPDEQALKEMYDEERVLFLQDWYHRTGPSLRTGVDSEPFIWVFNSQSFLINGKGQFSGCLDGTESLCVPECSVQNYIESIDVKEGKTYRLRIINAASLFGINFAIANHQLTVVEADGTLTKPFKQDNLDIMVAQRFSVLFTADQNPDEIYWADTSVRYRNAPDIKGFAYLYYAGSNAPRPTSTDGSEGEFPTHPDWDDVETGIDLEEALFTKNIAKYADKKVLTSPYIQHNMIVVGTQARQASDNLLRWAANNHTMNFPPKPLILSAYEAVNKYGAAEWPDTEIVDAIELPATPTTTWDYTKTLQDEGISIFNEVTGNIIYKLVKGDIVELVLQNALALNGADEVHPWHLHGHAFYHIGQGRGTFDPNTDPANFNLADPIRRDTVTVLPLGWTAIRFHANNPGAWPFHCTISAHTVMGMGFTFVTSPDKLKPPPPGVSSCLKTSLNVADAEVCTPIKPRHGRCTGCKYGTSGDCKMRNGVCLNKKTSKAGKGKGKGKGKGGRRKKKFLSWCPTGSRPCY